MLPCRKNCPHYCEGCHKTCAVWRMVQACQREENARKKEYLRRANENCRQCLQSCRQAGGYL
ncbi:MAG: hypothetical protein Q4Q08_06465 [Eubacteriales bacterium]|nr:hypothetical protein [Eubacteriales bacterium]